MVGAVGPHHNPLLPRTHLPLLKYWYLGDEESGRKSRPIGSMLVPHPRPLQVFPSLHTCSVPSPHWASHQASQQPSLHVSPLGRPHAYYLSHPTLPQPPPQCPRSLTLEAGGEPQQLVLPAWAGGAGLRRGWEEAPWVPGGLEPTAFPGGALRVRTGALRSEEGAGSWSGLLQVGTPQGPPHHLPWVWVWGLIPTLLTPCWRLCPRARPP